MKPKPAPLPDAADRQIDNTLAALARKHGYEAGGVEHSTPLSALLAAEDGDELLCADSSDLTVMEVKVAAWRAQLAWVFEKGADPRIAMRRLFAMAHEIGPQHLRDLTHEEIALLLGDGAGRATSSARSQAIFGGLKSALGIVTEFGTGHKSRGSRDRMSASGMGNKNRAGGAARAQIEQMPPQPFRRSTSNTQAA